jgi:hypothetical protein
VVRTVCSSRGLAGHRHVARGDRHVHAGRVAAGEHLLDRPRVVPQQAQAAPVVGGLRIGQALPQFRVGHLLFGVLDDERVEVDPAQVVDAVDGPHVEALAVAHDHARVEGAAAEVVDQQALVLGELLTQYTGEILSGGDRLGHEGGLGEAGQFGALDEGEPAADAPRCGVGERESGRRAAADAGGLERDRGKDAGDQRGDRELLLAEQHAAVVDATLGARLEPCGVHPGRVDGVAADEEPAVGLGVDG